MLGVSGVVPDGVAAAYLTAPDGTAVRADVADNAYAFVVPAPATRRRGVTPERGAACPAGAIVVAPVPRAPSRRRARPVPVPVVTPVAPCVALPVPVPVP